MIFSKIQRSEAAFLIFCDSLCLNALYLLFKYMNSITAVTTHFNPFNSRPSKDVYYKWLPLLGELRDHLKVYELVFDDADSEIENSEVIRGTKKKNLMWQKEALLNQGLKEAETEYFCWLDHDVVFKDEDWLDKAIDVLNQKDVDAVHCLDHSVLLGENYEVISDRHWTPGYAWISTTAYLKKRNGFFPYAIVGGGDSIWIDQDHIVVEAFKNRNFELSEPPRWKNLDSGVFHLWHGDYKERQYLSRHKILSKHNFQKEDVRINEDGILEWSSDKPDMHKAIEKFFTKRVRGKI